MDEDYLILCYDRGWIDVRKKFGEKRRLEKMFRESKKKDGDLKISK